MPEHTLPPYCLLPLASCLLLLFPVSNKGGRLEGGIFELEVIATLPN